MFTAGFIGSPQMNFVDAVLSKNSDGVFLEFNGETVLRKDEDNAEKWFGKAAEQKHEQGLVRVCEIAEKYIKAGKKNLGINWYKRAAKIGYEPAKKALADLGQRF